MPGLEVFAIGVHSLFGGGKVPYFMGLMDTYTGVVRGFPE